MTEVQKWLPIKVRPDKKARGFKPEAGWYCFSTKTLVTDLSKHFPSKKLAQEECDRRSGTTSGMVGRKVRSDWHNVSGVVEKWEPLGAGMTDILVRKDDGSVVWMSSSDVKPTDGKGPLPSRKAAIKKNKAVMEKQITEIGKRWAR